jgi:hypothetical protein
MVNLSSFVEEWRYWSTDSIETRLESFQIDQELMTFDGVVLALMQAWNNTSDENKLNAIGRDIKCTIDQKQNNDGKKKTKRRNKKLAIRTVTLLGNIMMHDPGVVYVTSDSTIHIHLPKNSYESMFSIFLTCFHLLQNGNVQNIDDSDMVSVASTDPLIAHAFRLSSESNETPPNISNEFRTPPCRRSATGKATARTSSSQTCMTSKQSYFNREIDNASNNVNTTENQNSDINDDYIDPNDLMNPSEQNTEPIGHDHDRSRYNTKGKIQWQ